jgi:predicted metalloenzyme YecM
MKNIEQFYRDSKDIVTVFNAFVAKHSLVGRAAADHICYKCGSRESFEAIRQLLENESEYIYQSIISKRRIAIVRLKQGIETSLGTIYFLELSDQKPDGSQIEGFDHIEVYPLGQTYDDFVETMSLRENVVKVERPHHTTHDIDMAGAFVFRCTSGPLIEKIKNTEL